ncbi:MAG: arginine decarboxylase, pyruvoyl-dependent [Firmicutes bacterium]|jgi:arginine decarboxylase|nr:arginine decarboxylase, pyruvoyl-dependent [Bacillota bacterium]
MLAIPTRYSLTSGRGEGGTRLTAFDAALLDAGLGDVNLVKVSSIIPPAAVYADLPEMAPGSLVPVAYGYIVSDAPGEIISAGVAAGVTSDSFGVIMEYSGRCHREETERTLEGMVKESLARRGLRLKSLVIRSVQHEVLRCGCAFAAVALWSG